MFPSALCLTVSLCLVFSVDGGQRSGIGNILRRYSQVNDYQHLPLLQINLISPQTIHVDRKEAKRARETETDREKRGYKQAEAYHNLMAYFTCFFFKERKTCIVLRMQMRKNVRASQGRKKIGQAVGGHFWDTLTLSHMQCFPRSLNCYSRYCAETPMCDVCDQAHSKSRTSNDKTIAYFSGCLSWSP